MTNEAIILAGGLGTRLREVVSDVPKSMAIINGRPFLEYQLKFLESWGIDHVVMSVGYKKEVVQNYFGKKFSSINIDYAIEDEPLGTGGGIRNAFELIHGHGAFVLNGDTFFEVNLKRLFECKRIKEADLCMAIRYVHDISRYGSVEIDDDYRITGFTEKGEKQGEGYMNGGVYYFTKKYFLSFDFPAKYSIEKDFFEKFYESQRFFGMSCHSYFLDIGIPDDYERAQHEFERLQY